MNKIFLIIFLLFFGMNLFSIEQPEMVFVKGGTFIMGITAGGDSDERPAHKVTVDSFYISKYEITHKQFIEFLNDAGVSDDGEYNDHEVIDLDDRDCAIGYKNGRYYFKGSLHAESEDCPVIEVTFYGATEFCNWLSKKARLTSTYEGEEEEIRCNFQANGYRLPTEAEWDFAARGGIKSRGYKFSGSEEAGLVAWHLDNAGKKTHEVGQKLPNELGIYDMSGNVWEWCWDYKNTYTIDAQTNPTGPAKGSRRVRRGGSWAYGAKFVRCFFRRFSIPEYGNSDLGFRIVRSK